MGRKNIRVLFGVRHAYVFVIYISLISDVSVRKYSCCHELCCSALFTDCCGTFALLFRGRITARKYSFHCT